MAWQCVNQIVALEHHDARISPCCSAQLACQIARSKNPEGMWGVGGGEGAALFWAAAGSRLRRV